MQPHNLADQHILPEWPSVFRNNFYAPLPVQVDAESPVAIFAENKDHAIAVGLTKMSTKDIREINKDIGVENVHYLNDGLWKNNKFV